MKRDADGALLVALVVAVDPQAKMLKIAVPMLTDQQESMASRMLEIIMQNLPYITAEADSSAPAAAREWMH